jgi:hypothetical protein
MIRSHRLVWAVVLLAACDFPTEVPRWEQTWVLPAEAVSIAVADVLPAGIGVTADRSAFLATTTAVNLSVTLDEMCPPCTPFEGLVVPKPAFTTTLPGTAALPADLLGAALAGGSVEVTLEHTFSFDPIRPAGAGGPMGHIVLTVTSNGAVVARDSVSGNDRAFPAHSPLRATIPVAQVTVSNELAFEVRIYSPEGPPTLIRSSDRLTVHVAPSELRIAQATVRATGLEVAPTRESLALDVDTTMIDRIQRGAIRFHVQNPWELNGTLGVRFELEGRAIERTLPVQPGSFRHRIEFTGQELRDILGAPNVDLVTWGTVSAPGGAVTVRPDQVLVLETEFELVILVGSRESTP